MANHELSRLSSAQTLSIRLYHLLPLTPVSKATNMRSVQTERFTHFQRSRVSPAGLAALFASALVPVSHSLSSFCSILASAFLRLLTPRRYVAPLLRYYGRSDLCRARLSANKRPSPRLFPAGVPAGNSRGKSEEHTAELPSPT